jgi:hypothetical protein
MSAVVTLCSSMRFFEQMLQVAADETANGRIVLAPFSVVAPENQDTAFKRMLDQLHRQKIDLADEVVVITNQHGYIGESTAAEIRYAEQQGKPWRVREFRLPEPTPRGGLTALPEIDREERRDARIAAQHRRATDLNELGERVAAAFETPSGGE